MQSVSRALIVIVVIASVISFASCERVFHPTAVPSEWTLLDEDIPSESVVRVQFALNQRNLDVLEKTLNEVSDPTHTRYGRHLSLNQLSRLIAPKTDHVNRVRSYLVRNGFKSISFTAMNDYVTASASVSTIERVLSTDLRAYAWSKHDVSIIRAAVAYSIPNEIDQFIHSVPGVHGFPYSLPEREVDSSSSTRSLQSLAAATSVLPNDVISLYSISEPSSSVTGSSAAVVEFNWNWYSPSDLETFFQKYTPSQSGRNITELYGNNKPGIHTGVEANLDVQYLMGIGWNVDTYAYTMPFSTDILDSFMLYTQVVNNQTNPPLVHSISFGEYGGDYPNSTVQLLDVEFQKMGVRGVSILVASGDNGVGCNKNCSSEEFDFPSSPYITLVGATELIRSNMSETGAKFSSGGFSRDQWRPSYQNAAVSAYLSSDVPKPPQSFYDPNGRAYPDISAVGVDIGIIVNGKPTAVDGTSCSAPIFAAVVSLLNNERLAAGKSPLGFLNPLFYQNPQVFTDILSGSNPYLCCRGFQAAKGWDPVTGLGTPVYSKLLSLVKSLP